MKHITVLSGAGISAESGLKTFRDSDGLWMGHKIEDVATPQAFKKIPNRYWNFTTCAGEMLLLQSPTMHTPAW